MRAGKIAEGEALVGLFLKEPDSLNILFDMQCMWFELAAGDAHAAAGDLKSALTQYLAVDTHFRMIQEVTTHPLTRRTHFMSPVTTIPCDSVSRNPWNLRVSTLDAIYSPTAFLCLESSLIIVLSDNLGEGGREVGLLDTRHSLCTPSR